MKKARWLILGLTVVISITVYVNWYFINKDDGLFTVSEGEEYEEYEKILGQSTYVNANESSYFENARFLRKKNRDDAIAVLNQLIENEDADDTAKRAAAVAIADYAKTSEKESVLENIIMAKGFTDCIAYVGADNVSIVIETQGLKPHEAAQIMDIAASETKFSTDVIKIIEISSIQN
ncbi:MAG: SpoIIIAH-like family protein [Clostridia bacterium]|nr:SpoIIIAH-like family protein [Clostridia bacterium]